MSMSPEEIEMRIAGAALRDFLAFVSGEDLPLWYLSFVDDEIGKTIPLEEQRPGGPSWLGACLVPAMDATAAVAAAWRLGCNPGGSVAMHGPFDRDEFKPEFIGYLLTSQDQVNEAHI